MPPPPSFSTTRQCEIIWSIIEGGLAFGSPHVKDEVSASQRITALARAYGTQNACLALANPWIGEETHFHAPLQPSMIVRRGCTCKWNPAISASGADQCLPRARTKETSDDYSQPAKNLLEFGSRHTTTYVRLGGTIQQPSHRSSAGGFHRRRARSCAATSPLR